MKDKVSDLVDADSMLMSLGFVIITSHLGKKFLSHSLLPLIKEINNDPRFLEVNEVTNVMSLTLKPQRKFPDSEDALWVLGILERAMINRREKIHLCPM